MFRDIFDYRLALYLNNCEILSDSCLANIEGSFTGYMNCTSEEESIACISRGLEEFGKGLTGKSNVMVEKAVEKYVRSNENLFFPQSKELVKLVKTFGYKPIGVSRVPYMEANAVAKYLGIDKVHAIDFAVDNGRYTGRISPYCPINGTKEIVFDKYRQQENASNGLIAIGNQASDFPARNMGKAGVVPGVVICSEERPISKSLRQFAEENNLLIVDFDNGRPLYHIENYLELLATKQK